MKTDMLLSDFVTKVKEELVAAQCKPEEAFYELTDVELEVSFALATTGKTKGKLVVIELGGEVTASQTHHVRLKLRPVGNKFQSKIVGQNDESSELSSNTSKSLESSPISKDSQKKKSSPVAGLSTGVGGYRSETSSLDDGDGTYYNYETI
ncbi:trypco2 family protein [Vreelandella piezotolerans]|uniref:trypco2 family protein n=1 Tax=Vreelandella piezotolerans TaxID=2609667 RepID=UPI001C6350BC|nr:trypco2 family protein [Halomonas piezotolerans]